MLMLSLRSPAIALVALAQSFSVGVLPGQAAQNCGPGAHWVQTGPMLGAGYCKPKHHKDHFVPVGCRGVATSGGPVRRAREVGAGVL